MGSLFLFTERLALYFYLLRDWLFIFIYYFFLMLQVLSCPLLICTWIAAYRPETIKAIIRKSIMFDIRSPYLNSVVEPARLVTLTDRVSRLPLAKRIRLWDLLGH